MLLLPRAQPGQHGQQRQAQQQVDGDDDGLQLHGHGPGAEGALQADEAQQRRREPGRNCSSVLPDLIQRRQAATISTMISTPTAMAK
jgi:hypothetical protein